MKNTKSDPTHLHDFVIICLKKNKIKKSIIMLIVVMR
jgi:hypothetical protein